MAPDNKIGSLSVADVTPLDFLFGVIMFINDHHRPTEAVNNHAFLSLFFHSRLTVLDLL